ncbi:MAG TPA: hypothetical protein H9874_03730 [Candidatus Bilophila faecipullorum]|uniref:Uncharacterized protein n=1 Tax=Candidatus Bilophila faecipullorum TaxID=2838482 RepID=A0A9D1U8L6_9BACT|nr:hypothetical protein [Candidatus Bilophila faecipullorum]
MSQTLNTCADFDPRETQVSVGRIVKHHDALQALHDLVDAGVMADLKLSGDGRDGLAFILKLLADDLMAVHENISDGVKELIRKAGGVRHE